MYIIPIKIGFTSNVDQRIAHLRVQTIHPIVFLHVLPGTRGHEKTLHTLLSDHRVKGEWFADCGPVRDLMAAVQANGWDGIEPVSGRVRTSDPYTINAQELASLIMRVSPSRDSTVRHLEDLYGVPTGLLWTLKYRPMQSISPSQYVAVIIGTKRALADAFEALASSTDHVRALQKSFGDITKKVADLDEIIEARIKLAQARGMSREEAESYVRNN